MCRCPLTDRCGIYFDLTDLDGSNSRLVADDGTTVALQDVTHVRLTAIVKSDERVAYDAERQESAGASAEISKVVRDDSCRRVTRHTSSAFASEGTGLVRDDSAPDGAMEKTAARLRATTEPMCKGVSAGLPWLDLGIRVGERVSEVEGRPILPAGSGGEESDHPLIRRIEYDFASQRTELTLVAAGSRA